jgi:hypothetical protein
VGVTLYHGTTLPAAESILREGWKATSVANQVDDVANANGIDPAEVWEELASLGRHVVGPNRGAWASFSPHREVTMYSWAQRAPEATWEALWSVWRLRHPELGEDWNLDTRGHVWVWEQIRGTPLAVIEYRTTYDGIVERGGYARGFGGIPGGEAHQFLRESLPPRSEFKRWFARTSEMAFDLPFAPQKSRLSLVSVERTVDWMMYANLLGMTESEFKVLDRQGRFGAPASDSVPAEAQARLNVCTPWWTTNEVLDFLAAWR